MRTSLIEKPAPVPFVAKSRAAMGKKAAQDIACELRKRLQNQQSVRMILAAAPSQSEMLAALILMPDVDWSRVTAFHMDEYLGLASEAPQRFGLWLRRAIFDRLPFAAVHLLEPGTDPEATAAEYADRLAAAPIDIVCCGIGSNGHLAFNDPPADLDDPFDVKVVALDTACRQQQVDDRCFERFDDVPTHALTLTIPRLLAADRVFCCVPGTFKRTAVRRALQDPISGLVPATALRTHSNWSLYLDEDSAADLASPEAQ
ncbi:MAG TPA: glucosamine-6-phosphate deaminase [Acidobacteriaceae bacterium]|jgi:glucosamine-6-phosphate deaminase|nr:glucosamine-6-phosphate deaminase [Acidobacteriaceae bacterium]